MSANWFNHSSITNLSSLAGMREGWSGTIQATSGSCQGGSGSAGWVIAKHCMSYLAGEPNVIFRFTFGAGTTCNNYDGLAFDDITIEEAPALVPSFTYSCLSSNTVGFSDQSGTCASAWSWNFDDPGSANNTANVDSPVHTFSAAGSFNVTLTAYNNCLSGSSVSQTIQVIQPVIATTDVSCYGGNDGSSSISIPGSGGPYSYHWNTNPVQTTASATSLTQGTYIYIISGSNACADTGTVTINQPSPLSVNLVTIPAHCGFNNGTASANVSGGTPGYSYNWSTGNGNVSSIDSLAPGNYVLNITDSHGCSLTDSFPVGLAQALSISLTAQTATCGMSNGSVLVTVNGGISPYAFSWLPDISISNSASNLSGGSYSITITDSTGCTEHDTAVVGRQQAVRFSVATLPDTCDRKVGFASVSLISGVPPFQYAWFPGTFNSPTVDRLGYGDYAVTVTDSNGCSASLEARIHEDCLNDLVIPNAFTPNGDGKNDFFFASGLDVTAFAIEIYNRWGIKVFESSEIHSEWDGSYNGKPQEDGIYVWHVSFSMSDSDLQQKTGTVLLIR